MTKNLIGVGYWAPNQDDTISSLLLVLLSPLPRVKDCVDPSWSREERERVLEHLRRGRVHDASFGFSSCRFCGQHNGTRDMTDGTYVWPEGFAHYLTHHDVKPPPYFIHHVLTSAMKDLRR